MCLRKELPKVSSQREWEIGESSGDKRRPDLVLTCGASDLPASSSLVYIADQIKVISRCGLGKGMSGNLWRESRCATAFY